MIDDPIDQIEDAIIGKTILDVEFFSNETLIHLSGDQTIAIIGSDMQAILYERLQPN